MRRQVRPSVVVLAAAARKAEGTTLGDLSPPRRCPGFEGLAGAGTVKEEGSAKKQCSIGVEKAAGKARPRRDLNLKQKLGSGLYHTIYSLGLQSQGF